jgi:hypothetical protein
MCVVNGARVNGYALTRTNHPSKGESMHRTLLAAIAAVLSLPAFASNPPNVLPKERTADTAAHACQPATAADAGRIAWNTFAAINTSARPARIICGAPIALDRPGTVAFGAKLNNLTDKVVSVTCTGQINTGDNAGAWKFTRSVMVSPGEQARIEWDALDVNRATLDGGQAGFECTLPPGLRLRWVYTVGVDN